MIAVARKGDTEGFDERVQLPEGNNDFCETCLSTNYATLPTDSNGKIRVLINTAAT